MFIFDLTNPTGKNQYKLPDVSKWFSPNFTSLGDVVFNLCNEPKNFKIDFPDYVYTYDKLYEMKQKLNEAKKPMDKINSTAEGSKKYYLINNSTDSYDALRGDRGVLAQEYNAEIVTNAWLKMYETMDIMKEYLEKLNRSSQTFNSCHFAEAPGNFLLAINHYIKTNMPKISWDWLASTYRDLYNEKSMYLDDAYGIIYKYQNKWIYGADGDGDITSPANIVSFKQDSTKLGKINLVTSDVKYAPKNMNYDEEENYNIPVHLGHLMCALTILSQGGIMMLKEFTFYESSSVSMLYLMSCCFDKLLIVKPFTSRSANSEVYIFGIGYKKNLTNQMIEKLLKMLGYIKYLNNENGSPAIFTKNDIPEHFVKRVEELNSTLLETQLPAIKKNINSYEEHKNDDINKMYRDASSNRDKIAREWIKLNNVKPLNTSSKLGAIKKRL